MRGLALGALMLAAVTAASGPAGGVEPVGERRVFDNEKVTVMEYTFPPGFKGDEHAAFANEFAYVLAGDFTVTTQGRGRRVVHPGEVEYASQGTVHTSSNEGKTPAAVLVVILK
jgi:quercetin dioxygenase-like cupin family protein